MNKRSYNIFFHLHTVTGIVISVLLYVIFFAGSFSFFLNEIIAWERNDSVGHSEKFGLNVDATLDTLATRYNLSGRNINFHKHAEEKRFSVSLSAPRDTLLGKEGAYFSLDPKTYKHYPYEQSYSLGEFLYRLHFFAQIPYPAGYYLSGFTALFFLFAILTGILVHWKKIISNFYLFRPWEKLKTVWTDAHTVLGTIGLPFQVVYAVTGAFFMINILLVIPSLMVLYDGDQKKFYDDLGYGQPEFAYENKHLAEHGSLNGLVDRGEVLWKNFQVTEVSIYNYGDQSMHLAVGGELDHATKFTGFGEVTYKVSTLEAVAKKDPYEATAYLDGVKGALYHLHFGDYGGYAVKGISFLLGLITCFVIITGILIWLEARTKKSVPEKEKRFNRWVGHIYLSLCLTMYPVTAAAFLVTKLLPPNLDDVRLTLLYSTYFGSWLVSAVFFAWKRDNYFINKYTLLAGAVIGSLVPIFNGIGTGKWPWVTFRDGHTDIFVVDMLWILISVAAFYSVLRLRKTTLAKQTSDVLLQEEAAVGAE
jgi:uncharacterized iron-regulated membrane protein